jgi:hypothetical protein
MPGMMRIPLLVAAALVSVLVAGCSLMAGSYHSAKLLPKGDVSYGLNVSTISLQYADESGERPWTSLANPVPEGTLHYGWRENTEVGFRLGPTQLGLELDIKQRIASPGCWHFAIGAALFGQAMNPLLGGGGQGMLLATWERSDDVRLTWSLSGRFSWLYQTGFFGEEYPEGLDELEGTLGAVAGSFGVELVDGSYTVRPGVEVACYCLGVDEAAAGLERFFTISLILHVSKTSSDWLFW